MEVREDMAGSVCRLHVAGEMTIYSALELKEHLLGSLARCAELDVNSSDVTEVDSAGLQLLLLAKREARSVGKQMRVSDPSQAMQEALQQFCLSPTLEYL